MMTFIKYNSKLLLFVFLVLVGILYIFRTIDHLSKQLIISEANNYTQRAQTHFKTLMDIRTWSESMHDLYTFKTSSIKPNPYLRDNLLVLDTNRSLGKINSAWMTRMISEVSNNSEFKFKTVSDKPLNPKNMAEGFDLEAIQYLNVNKSKEDYYRFEENEFLYLGVLKIKPSCLECHADYNIGDIRGGISLRLNSENLNELKMILINQDNIFKVIIVLLGLLLIGLFYFVLHYAQQETRLNNVLEDQIDMRTIEIEKTKLLLENVLDNESSFIMVIENDLFYYVNKTVLDFFNVETSYEFKQKYPHFSYFFDDKLLISEHYGMENSKIFFKKIQHKEWNNFYCTIVKDDKEYYFRPLLKIIIQDNKILKILILHEVTNSICIINELSNIANHDVLTKLANRVKFNEVLDEMFAKFIQHHKVIALLFIDIDFFKDVNDTHGHDIGDKTLIKLSNILESEVRKKDLVARWGGEEFVIILDDIDEMRAVSIANKLRTKVEKLTFEKVGSITISVGVSLLAASDDAQSLVKRADEALYEAKNSGRNKVIFKSV